MLSYMSVLIKISNHLLLILPGKFIHNSLPSLVINGCQFTAPTDTPEQVNYDLIVVVQSAAYIYSFREIGIKLSVRLLSQITAPRCTAKQSFSHSIVASGG